MIKLDYLTLERDMLKKLVDDDISQETAEKQMGMSRIVFRNVREQQGLRLNTFLSVVNWLGNGTEKYFITE